MNQLKIEEGKGARAPLGSRHINLLNILGCLSFRLSAQAPEVFGLISIEAFMVPNCCSKRLRAPTFH